MKKIVSYKATKEDLEKAQKEAFNKVKNKYKINGFRPGKAPREIFEKNYPGVIMREAADILVDREYRRIIVEDKIFPILEPEIAVKNLDDKGLEVEFTLITEPSVKLGQYKNLGVKKDKITVTKEEINNKINDLLKDYAELVVKDEGTVEEGDTAIIDFEGFRDGIAFARGKGENYPLEIGSKNFIPGFEEGIIGMKKDEEKDLDLTFPEDYGQSDLAGAKVTFKVKVNEIKREVIPELNEEFFDDLGMENVTTKEELEEKIKKEIKDDKEQAANQKYVDELLEKAVSNMEVDIDEEIVLNEVENMYKEFMNNLASQGFTEELYLKYSGKTSDEVKDSMKDEALKRLQNTYLLNNIVLEEKISVTDEEITKEVESIATKYKTLEGDVLSAIGGKNVLRQELLFRKAIDIMKGTEEVKEAKED